MIGMDVRAAELDKLTSIEIGSKINEHIIADSSDARELASLFASLNKKILGQKPSSAEEYFAPLKAIFNRALIELELSTNQQSMISFTIVQFHLSGYIPPNIGVEEIFSLALRD